MCDVMLWVWLCSCLWTARALLKADGDICGSCHRARFGVNATQAASLAVTMMCVSVPDHISTKYLIFEVHRCAKYFYTEKYVKFCESVKCIIYTSVSAS